MALVDHLLDDPDYGLFELLFAALHYAQPNTLVTHQDLVVREVRLQHRLDVPLGFLGNNLVEFHDQDISRLKPRDLDALEFDAANGACGLSHLRQVGLGQLPVVELGLFHFVGVNGMAVLLQALSDLAEILRCRKEGFR